MLPSGPAAKSQPPRVLMLFEHYRKTSRARGPHELGGPGTLNRPNPRFLRHIRHGHYATYEPTDLRNDLVEIDFVPKTVES